MKSIAMLLRLALMMQLIILIIPNYGNAQSSGSTIAFADQKNTVALNRGGDFSMQLLPDTRPEKFVLVINNPRAQKLFYWVSTSEGDMTSEKTSEKYLTTRMDMAGVADGIYVVSVSNGKTTQTRKIQFSTAALPARKLTIVAP